MVARRSFGIEEWCGESAGRACAFPAVRTMRVVAGVEEGGEADTVTVQGRTERMSADGRYGVGMRWLAPAPSPLRLRAGFVLRLSPKGRAAPASLESLP